MHEPVIVYIQGVIPEAEDRRASTLFVLYYFGAFHCILVGPQESHDQSIGSEQSPLLYEHAVVDTA